MKVVIIVTLLLSSFILTLQPERKGKMFGHLTKSLAQNKAQWEPLQNTMACTWIDFTGYDSLFRTFCIATVKPYFKYIEGCYAKYRAQYPTCTVNEFCTEATLNLYKSSEQGCLVELPRGSFQYRSCIENLRNRYPRCVNRSVGEIIQVSSPPPTGRDPDPEDSCADWDRVLNKCERKPFTSGLDLRNCFTEAGDLECDRKCGYYAWHSWMDGDAWCEANLSINSLERDMCRSFYEVRYPYCLTTHSEPPKPAEPPTPEPPTKPTLPSTAPTRPKPTVPSIPTRTFPPCDFAP